MPKPKQNPIAIAAQLYSDDLRRYLQSRVGTREDAEDVLQDVFLHATRMENPEELRHPRAFLFSVARNIVTDRFRKKATEPVAAISEDAYNNHPDHRPSPESQMAHRQDFKILCDAIATLSPQVRRAMILRKFYGLSYQEIANEMGIAPKTVENHLAKAVVACAIYMKHRGVTVVRLQPKALPVFWGRQAQGEK